LSFIMARCDFAPHIVSVMTPVNVLGASAPISVKDVIANKKIGFMIVPF
jgi:hypothetical protein